MRMSDDPPGENGLPRDAPKAVGIGQARWQTTGNCGTQNYGTKVTETLPMLRSPGCDFGKPLETMGRKARGLGALSKAYARSVARQTTGNRGTQNQRLRGALAL